MIQFSVVPLRSEDGNLQAIAAIMRDVTEDFEERKRLRACFAVEGTAEAVALYGLRGGIANLPAMTFENPIPKT